MLVDLDLMVGVHDLADRRLIADLADAPLPARVQGAYLPQDDPPGTLPPVGPPIQIGRGLCLITHSDPRHSLCFSLT